MFNINNIFGKMTEGEKKLAGINTENVEKEPTLKTLDGEDFYVALLTELTEKNNGVATKEDTEKAKEIVNFLQNNGFKEEITACSNLHSKECAEQILSLYALAQKN